MANKDYKDFAFFIGSSPEIFEEGYQYLYKTFKTLYHPYKITCQIHNGFNSFNLPLHNGSVPFQFLEDWQVLVLGPGAVYPALHWIEAVVSTGYLASTTGSMYCISPFSKSKAGQEAKTKMVIS